VVFGAAVVAVGAAPEVALAMTGDALAAVGAAATMPVAALLFGYGVHVSCRVLPETTSDRATAGSTVRLMAPPVAVKGPTVAGVVGRFSVSPDAGTGLGIGALIVTGGAATDAGVAPVASTLSVAVPVMEEFPRAAAADTMALGSTTVVELLVRLNVAPAAGDAGVMVPVVIAPFRAMFPTGVPGQKTS
jgi:hypothetical protein